MKKNVSLIVVLISLLSFSVKSKAQVYAANLHGNIDFGIKAGGNFSQLVASPFIPSYNSGFTGGLYGGKNWGKIGIHVEALVNNATYTTEYAVTHGLRYEKGMDTTTKGKFNALYLSVPVLVDIKLKKRWYLEVGPQYNYMLSFKDNNGAYTKEYKNDKILKNGEVCLDLGLKANLSHGFNLGIRYVKGLTDVNKNVFPRAYDAWQANNFQIMLGFKIM